MSTRSESARSSSMPWRSSASLDPAPFFLVARLFLVLVSAISGSVDRSSRPPDLELDQVQPHLGGGGDIGLEHALDRARPARFHLARLLLGVVARADQRTRLHVPEAELL